MDSNNSVDFSEPMGYNKSEDENMIIVKMAEHKPIHDKACPHKELKADPDDRIGDAVYHGCTNPNCNVGFYLRK